MTIRKLQFDFPNHSNERKKAAVLCRREASRQGGFYGSRCSSVFLFIQAGAWWFLCRLKQARLREPAEVRALSFHDEMLFEGMSADSLPPEQRQVDGILWLIGALASVEDIA